MVENIWVVEHLLCKFPFQPLNKNFEIRLIPYLTKLPPFLMEIRGFLFLMNIVVAVFIDEMTMASFAITLYGKCCRLQISVNSVNCNRN